MISYRTPLYLLALASLIVFAGCTDDPLYPSRQVTVSAVKMPPLDRGAYYELWLAYPRDRAESKGSRVDRDERQFFSVGKFTVDLSGALKGIDGGAAAFTVPVGYNADLFSSVIITVERSDKSDSVPGARLLSGELAQVGSQNVARLSLNGNDAFGSSLDTLLQDTLALPNREMGSFLLDTPTTPDESDYTQGIWFIKSDLKTRGLPLHAQPLNSANPQWKYESWLVHNPGSPSPEYISLGRFDSPSAADSNGPGSGAGANLAAAYKVPGEDFVADGMKRVLSDGSYGVVVSLAPENVALDHPLIVLFRRDTIPVPALRLQSADLNVVPFEQQPIVDISFER